MDMSENENVTLADIIRAGVEADDSLTELEIAALPDEYTTDGTSYRIIDSVEAFWEPGYNYSDPEFWEDRSPDLSVNFIRAVRSYDRLHRDD